MKEHTLEINWIQRLTPEDTEENERNGCIGQ